MLRPEVDRHKCVGSGNCLFWAPSTFDLDDEGMAVVVDPDGDDEDRIRVAVDGCPSRALALIMGNPAESGPDPVGTMTGGERSVDDRSVRDLGEENHGHRPVR